jgi:hypothetical protein
MKILRVVLYVLGILWTVAYLLTLTNMHRKDIPADGAERVGYYFGSALVLAPGIVFILLARKITKKLQRKKEQELVDSLPGN